jgi:hypothetical protein
MNRQIEIGIVVGDVDVGILGRRRSVERLPLHELGDARRIRPDRIVQQAVDGRRGQGPPRLHRHPSGERTGIPDLRQGATMLGRRDDDAENDERRRNQTCVRPHAVLLQACVFQPP